MSIFADDFVDMMPATIAVRSFTGRAADGTPIYGATNSYRARINNKIQNIIGKDGQQVTIMGTAWLDTVATITVNDEVTFPDGSKPILQAVNRNTDETGDAYTAIFFQ